MLRATAFAALAAAMLAAPVASAQVIDLGGGGPRIDLRSDGQRDRDRDRRRMMRHERHHDHGDRYGRRGGGCREVSVTRTDDYGRRVTRTKREC